MATCHQQICPHMHFNKCYQQRIRSIPVSIFPDPTIDSFTNINVKCGKPFKSNIPTVAYENFIYNHELINDERNFIKDFYMQNYEQDKIILNNNIVEQKKQEMYRNSAYVLALGATKDYDTFQEKRKRALMNARKRAQSAYHAFSVQKKQQKQKNYQENGYWLKKLFRKLQEVAHHIIHGKSQDANERQKQFLLSKADLTANFLSQIKIKNPKNAFEILEQVRMLMQKKKLKFSDQREEQQLNQSATQSFVSQTSQNTSQNSMISEATSLNESNMFGEDKIVEKFWDFDQLKKKWNLEDIQNVKHLICRILTRKIISDAQLEAVKRRRQAQKLNQKLLGINTKVMDKETNKQKQLKDKNQMKKSLIKKGKKQQILVDKKLVDTKNLLTKAEQSAKKYIIEGGRFDAIGEKFLRNKTYSQIFKNKQNQIKSVFIEKEHPQEADLTGKKSDKFMRSTSHNI